MSVLQKVKVNGLDGRQQGEERITAELAVPDLRVLGAVHVHAGVRGTICFCKRIPNINVWSTPEKEDSPSDGPFKVFCRQ